MRTLSSVLALALLLPPCLGAQSAGDSVYLRTLWGRRVLTAHPVASGAVVLDGRLEEPDWTLADSTGDFTEQNPAPGILPSRRTVARVLFDDRAIYLGVRAFDEHPDSILAPYPRRDDEARSDWIFVEIDSRHDRRTGFGFGVNPRGVQVDGAFDAVLNYDVAWNAVWDVATRIDSLGWVAEYRIPFSQLAYAGRPGQPLTWGLNVYRKTARNGESSDWSPRLPAFSDLVSHFNDLTGILPPAHLQRLELAPYSALKGSFAPRVPGDPLSRPSDATPLAGADFRYRLTPGFSLTAALHPDFGQVEADPSQVNLTTFETFFPEQRPFFVEGASQFAFDMSLPFTSRGISLGSDQPFYSRRIGRPPRGSVPSSARYQAIPASATVLGAAKVSGRSDGGWTVGALTAVTDASEGDYIDSAGVRRSVSVEPTTGYGVARVTRQSNDGRRSIGGIATFTDRFGLAGSLDSLLPRRAMLAGMDARLRFKEDRYEASGFALASRVTGSASAITRAVTGPGHFFQRPDAGYLDQSLTRTSLSGVAAQARFAKVGGALRWSAIGHLISPGFEVNDLGFQRNADWLLLAGTLTWERYRPGRFIRHWILGSDHFGGGWSFGGERRALDANGYLTLGLRNYWSGTLSATHEWTSLATELLRGGPGLLLPPRTTLQETIGTDSRKPLQLTLAGTQWSEPGSGSRSIDFSPSVAWRLTDRLAMSLGPEYTRTVSGWQYVTQLAPIQGGPPRYVLGRLGETTASLTARVDFAFNSRMTLQLYAQPFISAGRYTRFKGIANPRAARPGDRVVDLAPSQVVYDSALGRYTVDVDGDGTSDGSFAQPDFKRQDLNVNLVFRWEYRPGSTLYLVWTQQRSGEAGDGSFRLGRDLGDLFRRPATNVVMLKASYRVGG